LTWIPFLFLVIWLLLGTRPLSGRVLKLLDWIINIALIVLMLSIGMNIGINDSVILNLVTIGFNCMIIAISAIALSVVLVVVLEKTFLPFDKLMVDLYSKKLDINHEMIMDPNSEEKTSPLVWIMPASIIAGVVVGYFILSENQAEFLGYSLIGSLVLLYISVGISLGSNRKVFGYLRMIGFKVIFIPLAILIGSLAGGLL